MSIFDKWDKSVDTEGLANDVAEAEKNGGTGDYPEVPVGQYEIKIEKMLGSILYGDVADDEVQIVQRNEYVKVGFACLM